MGDEDFLAPSLTLVPRAEESRLLFPTATPEEVDRL